jgi:hypothetical protein
MELKNLSISSFTESAKSIIAMAADIPKTQKNLKYDSKPALK